MRAPPRSYAVKPVLSTHNQLVGSRLSTFVAEDHLLDGDACYVTDTPHAAGTTLRTTTAEVPFAAVSAELSPEFGQFAIGTGDVLIDLPGAESSVAPMRAVLADEPQEFVRDNVSAALNLFLRQS
ncbi:hypothetical protein [Amycolatopsis sp. NPDC004079]|uniref:hypothetical protein n=1 Tax=Amycolatopsis sp. NPDC004079 TaxID=3154549 RepID=UPI0033B7E8F2